MAYDDQHHVMSTTGNSEISELFTQMKLNVGFGDFQRKFKTKSVTFRGFDFYPNPISVRSNRNRNHEQKRKNSEKILNFFLNFETGCSNRNHSTCNLQHSTVQQSPLWMPVDDRLIYRRQETAFPNIALKKHQWKRPNKRRKLKLMLSLINDLTL